MTDWYDAYRGDPYRLSWRKVAALATGLALVAGVAAAQDNPQPGYGPPTQHMACADREAIAKVLAKDYGEHPVGMGVTGQGILWQLYVDPNDGSWSVTATAAATPDHSCLLGAGEGWQERSMPGVPS